MISKKKVAVIVIFFMLLSSAATFASILFLGIDVKGATMISTKDYEEYKYIKEEYGKLFDLKNFIEQNYYVPVKDEDLKIGMYKGLFQGIGDPYSSYMTKKEYDEMMISTQGEYQGIGVTIAPDDEGYINVVAPIEGSPAEKAGIKSGDKIVKIDGVEYSAKEMDKAVSKMRGKPGTKVVVSVLRNKDMLDFQILRANVVLKSVKSEVLNNNIGYIRISSFESKTADEFLAQLKEMEQKKVKGLMIDLRDNPGGLVDQSVKIADSLIGSGEIVYTQDRQGNKKDYKSDSSRTNLKYAVLVNGGSASASEILTAAIKDNKAGTVIGTKTFGKGIIQRVIPLENGDGLELTIAQYFSPNGHVIHKKGIVPDIIVEIDENQLKKGEITKENDPQIQKAVEVLTK